MKIPPRIRLRLRPLSAEAARRGSALFAVGGCVRDWLLGRPTKDLDFVCESDPAPLARRARALWGGKLEAFGRFGTLRLLGAGGQRADFVRARAESYPRPAALPVVRPGTLREDLERRDFTVNAMALRLDPRGPGELVDPFGGREDLRRELLRVLHDGSFRDDPTRLFRAARFSRRFGFRLEPDTERLRLECLRAGHARLLSRERLRGELLRALEEARPGSVLSLLRAWGLAGLLHPRLSWPLNLEQGRGRLERLGLMALRMGPEHGADFVRSLHLERPESQALLEALDLARRKASPRAPLPELSRRALLLVFPRLAPAALRPLLVSGEDLRRLGLEPGPAYRDRLERAGRAQWQGCFATRPRALSWLRSLLKP